MPATQNGSSARKISPGSELKDDAQVLAAPGDALVFVHGVDGRTADDGAGAAELVYADSPVIATATSWPRAMSRSMLCSTVSGGWVNPAEIFQVDQVSVG
jgi:hypothetical protein